MTIVYRNPNPPKSIKVSVIRSEQTFSDIRTYTANNGQQWVIQKRG